MLKLPPKAENAPKAVIWFVLSEVSQRTLLMLNVCFYFSDIWKWIIFLQFSAYFRVFRSISAENQYQVDPTILKPYGWVSGINPSINGLFFCSFALIFGWISAETQYQVDSTILKPYGWVSGVNPSTWCWFCGEIFSKNQKCIENCPLLWFFIIKKMVIKWIHEYFELSNLLT